MKLSAPRQVTFLVSIILGIFAILSQFVTIGTITTYGFWILAAAFILLVVGNMLEGL